MKFDLPRLTVMTALLLPLLFLVHACDCIETTIDAADNPAADSASAACRTMPPLPRLPRG